MNGNDAHGGSGPGDCLDPLLIAQAVVEFEVVRVEVGRMVEIMRGELADCVDPTELLANYADALAETAGEHGAAVWAVVALQMLTEVPETVASIAAECPPDLTAGSAPDGVW